MVGVEEVVDSRLIRSLPSDYSVRRTNGERCSRVNNSRFHKTPLSTQRIEVARRVTLPSEFDWNPGEYRESVEFPMNKSRQTIAWSWMDVFKRFKINKQASFHIPE